VIEKGKKRKKKKKKEKKKSLIFNSHLWHIRDERARAEHESEPVSETIPNPVVGVRNRTSESEKTSNSHLHVDRWI
jgi:hypothetical protein